SRLGPSYQVLDFSMGTKAIQNAGTNTAEANVTRVDSAYSDNAILTVWLGTNDIALDGDRATTAYNQLVSYCQARRAVGWRLIVATMLPRTGTDAARATFNTNIRSNYEIGRAH